MVNWTNSTNFTISDQTITKTSTNGYDANVQAESITTSATPQSFTFTKPDTSYSIIVGWGKDPFTTGNMYDAIEGAVALNNGGNYYYQQGGSDGLIGTYSADDSFKVEITSSNVKIYKNSSLVKTMTGDFSGTYYVQAIGYHQNATITTTAMTMAETTEEGAGPPEYTHT